eukprot:m.154588 g.154588  ORF g.154588 m.154588 type:complete len:483 (+) comp30896_c0_seq2:450-1898(+)
MSSADARFEISNEASIDEFIPRWGCSTMQGWRDSMEDCHTIKSIPRLPNHSWFAVYDGHGGSDCATAAAADDGVLLHFFRESAKCRDGAGTLTALEISDCLYHSLTQFDAMRAAEYEETVNSNNGHVAISSGSTAVVLVVTETHCIVTNVGDSRLVLSRGDGCPPFATEDHKPTTPRERARIMAAGGRVLLRRVNGVLAVSRVLGDFEMKNPSKSQANQVVTACGDVTILQRDKTNEFAVLACDGVWDVMGSTEVANFVRTRLRGGVEPVAISKALLRACLAAGTKDNLSAIVVDLRDPSDVVCGKITNSRRSTTIADVDDDRLDTLTTRFCTTRVELEHLRRWMRDISYRIDGLSPDEAPPPPPRRQSRTNDVETQAEETDYLVAVKKIDPTGHTTHPTSSSEKPTTVDITKHDADDVADVDAVANVNPDADTEVNTHEGDGNAFQRRLDDVASGFTKTETNLEACKILMQQVSLRLNAFS